MYLFAEVGQENLIGSLLDFHSNFINWLILLVIVAVLIRKGIPPIISQRQLSINTELEAAAQTRQNAEQALAEQKKQIEQASEAADKIVLEAKQTASQMVQEIHKQTEQDKSDLLKKFELAVSNERQAAVLEMRNIVAKAAIKLTEESLPAILTDVTKTNIGQQFIGELSHFGQPNAGNQSLEHEGNERFRQSVNDKNLVDS